MKKMKNWIYGGIIGLLVGMILFFWIVGGQFIANIRDVGVWRMFILVVLEPTLAGIIIPLIYGKLMKFKINKIVLWVIYLIILAVIVWFTIIWFLSLDLGVGIVGLR